MTERKIVQDAKKIEELMWQLEVNADQERMDELKPREIEEYPDEEILSEAQYVLSTYYDDSHHHGKNFLGENVELAQDHELKLAIEARKEARAEVRRLKRLLEKYSQ